MKKDGGYEVNIAVLGSGEKPVLSVDREIFRQASLLDLDEEMMHKVQEMYSKAKRRGLTKYKKEENVITALIYVMCRKELIPLTLHKICDVLRIDYRSINKVYRYLVKKMGIHVPATTPGEYLRKFAVDLRLPKTALERAAKIINLAKKSGKISGKGPAGVAAACVCLASDMEKLETDQKEVAELSGVTQVTIRNRYKELEECIDKRSRAGA